MNKILPAIGYIFGVAVYLTLAYIGLIAGLFAIKFIIDLF